MLNAVYQFLFTEEYLLRDIKQREEAVFDIKYSA